MEKGENNNKEFKHKTEPSILNDNNIMSKQEYFQALDKWLNQMKFVERINNCFPYYLMATYPQMFTNNNIDSSVNGPHPANLPRQTERPNNDQQGSDFESTVYIWRNNSYILL